MENVKKLSSLETIADVITTMSEEQKNVMDELIGEALSYDEKIEPHVRRRFVSVIATMSEKQKRAMYVLVGVALFKNDMLGMHEGGFETTITISQLKEACMKIEIE